MVFRALLISVRFAATPRAFRLLAFLAAMVRELSFARGLLVFLSGLLLNLRGFWRFRVKLMGLYVLSGLG